MKNQLLFIILILCFSLDSLASPSACFDLFATKAQIERAEYVISSQMQKHIRSGQVSAEMIQELFENRISEPIPELIGGQNYRYWFISENNQAQRFKVVVGLNGKRWDVIFIKPSTAAQERYYFRELGRNMPQQTYSLKRSLRGMNKLVIYGSILFKIYDKHRLTADLVVTAINNWDGKYYPNNDPRATADSFKIYGRIPGQSGYYVIFLAPVDNALNLVTAFWTR